MCQWGGNFEQHDTYISYNNQSTNEPSSESIIGVDLTTQVMCSETEMCKSHSKSHSKKAPVQGARARRPRQRIVQSIAIILFLDDGRRAYRPRRSCSARGRARQRERRRTASVRLSSLLGVDWSCEPAPTRPFTSMCVCKATGPILCPVAHVSMGR